MQVPENAENGKPTIDLTAKWRRILIIGIVVLAVVAVVGRIAIQVARHMSPERAVDRAAAHAETAVATVLEKWRAFNQTQIIERQADFVSGLPFSRDDMQLVVQRVDLTQNLYAENNKTKWGIDFGTTRVLLSVPARLFYAVDLSGRKPISFKASSSDGTFIATFPDPEVLAVEIYDEHKRELMDVGWGRFKARSGDAMLERLDQTKYQVIRERGESEKMVQMVREKARPVLARFIALYLRQDHAFGEGTGTFERIEVRFDGESPDAVPVFYDQQTLTLDPP